MLKNLAALLCAPVLLTLAPALAQPEAEAPPASSLAYTLTGEGSTTIVFEAGFGTDASVWAPVLAALDTDAKTLTYSRAGLGDSPAPETPRTIEGHLADLEGLLASLDIKDHIILVGHSYGGLLAAEYATNHPEQVSGLVLIDPATRGQRTIFRLTDSARIKSDDEMMLGYMPPFMKADYQILIDQMDAAPAEIAPVPGDLPVVLFTSTMHYDEPFVFEETDTGRQLWLDLHRTLIAESRDAVHIRMPDVGHNIHKQEPARVAAEISGLAKRIAD